VGRWASAWLDTLRLVAALTVFVSHVIKFFYPQAFPTSDRFAHNAVVVFFVLSGYVIAYTVDARKQTLREFAIARLSRLSSVAVPALVVTAVVTVLLHATKPEFYSGVSHGHEGVRFALTAVYLQSSWHHAAVPSLDGPFWSLAYEFWYYAMFGFAMLASSKLAKIAGVAVCALAAGPEILLLWPCWLAGVAAYRLRRSSPAMLAAGLVASGAALFAPHWPGPVGSSLLYAGAFGSDFLLAVCLAIALSALGEGDGSVSGTFAIRLRAAADLTFGLYLYHFPLVALAAAFAPNGVVVAAPIVLAAVIGLSLVTEGQRPAWRRLFKRLLPVLGQGRVDA